MYRTTNKIEVDGQPKLVVDENTFADILSPEDLIAHPELVNHPKHYGGESDPYEAIKVIEAWNLNFNLGNCLKYISRAGRKYDNPKTKDMKTLEDLKKAAWYMQREVERFEKELKSKDPQET